MLESVQRVVKDGLMCLKPEIIIVAHSSGPFQASEPTVSRKLLLRILQFCQGVLLHQNNVFAGASIRHETQGPEAICYDGSFAY